MSKPQSQYISQGWQKADTGQTVQLLGKRGEGMYLTMQDGAGLMQVSLSPLAALRFAEALKAWALSHGEQK